MHFFILSAKGDDGYPGINGRRGLPGETGINGRRGLPGVVGAKGKHYLYSRKIEHVF